MYTPHSSKLLTKIFSERPYQGAAPRQSQFLFVGLDANYEAGLEGAASFDRILEYHEDGVRFWRDHGVHHPFLLPAYRGSGKLYHRNFSQIGFTPEEAGKVSFIELLHIPTTGRSRLSPDDLSPGHLDFVSDSILSGTAKHVFVSDSVAKLMRMSGQFPWLPEHPISKQGSLGVYFDTNGTKIYKHLHFSVYGKFNAARLAQASDIRSLRPASANS